MQSLINVAYKDKVGGGENGGNKTNLSNLLTLKNYTGADYLISKDAKKGGDNPK